MAPIPISSMLIAPGERRRARRASVPVVRTVGLAPGVCRHAKDTRAGVRGAMQVRDGMTHCGRRRRVGLRPRRQASLHRARAYRHDAGRASRDRMDRDLPGRQAPDVAPRDDGKQAEPRISLMPIAGDRSGKVIKLWIDRPVRRAAPERGTGGGRGGRPDRSADVPSKARRRRQIPEADCPRTFSNHGPRAVAPRIAANRLASPTNATTGKACRHGPGTDQEQSCNSAN